MKQLEAQLHDAQLRGLHPVRTAARPRAPHEGPRAPRSAGGGEGDPGPASWPATSGCPGWRPATSSGRPCARARALGLGGQELHGPRRARPRRRDRRHAPRAPRRPGRRERRHPGRLPADARRRRRRSTARSPSAESNVDAALLVDVPADELLRPAVRALALRGGRPHLPRDGLPAAVAGVCDIAAPALIQRDDDKPDVVRARLEKQLGALADVVDHYRAGRRAPGRRRTPADRGRHERPARLHRARARLAHAPVITRKSPPRSPTMRRAGRVVAEVLALVEEELRPGVSTARLDDLAEDHIRQAGGDAVVQGLLRLPVLALHLDRPRGRPRDPGRPGHPRGPGRVDRRRGDRRRLPRRRGADVHRRRRAARRVRDLVEATRRALEAGIAAARPGNRIWDISAAVEDVALPARATGVVRPYVGHGIGTAMHEEPQVPNFRSRHEGDRAAARHLPGDRADVHARLADVETLADGWTVVTTRRVDSRPTARTRSRSPSNGPEILTRP